MSVTDTLLAMLGPVPHIVLRHPGAISAREAALARGTPLEIGGKSVVMKIDRIGLVVLVVGSSRRIDGRLLRKALQIQRYRFVSPDELEGAIGLPAGAVPPFGRPLLAADLYVGKDMLEREEIAFSAASRTCSVRMRVHDWLAVARPTVVPCFTEEDPG